MDHHNPATSEALTRFLINHPTIEDLSIGYSTDKTWRIELSLDHLTRTMLPNLRHLHGHIANVTALADLHVLSMRRLTRLHTGHGLCVNAVEDFEAMIESLMMFGGLPDLKDFRLEAGPSPGGSASSCPPLGIRSFYNCFPNIEHFTGDSEFVQTLVCFPDIISIRLVTDASIFL